MLVFSVGLLLCFVGVLAASTPGGRVAMAEARAACGALAAEAARGAWNAWERLDAVLERVADASGA